MGAIGQVIASQLADLGFDVHGWSRTKRNFGSQITAYHGRDGFRQLTQTCCCHVCILPLTPETEGLFSAEIFNSMPTGALFINGGRGKQVVEADLLAAIVLASLVVQLWMFLRLSLCQIAALSGTSQISPSGRT